MECAGALESRDGLPVEFGGFLLVRYLPNGERKVESTPDREEETEKES